MDDNDLENEPSSLAGRMVGWISSGRNLGDTEENDRLARQWSYKTEVQKCRKP